MLKLQRRGHDSDAIYLTSTSPNFPAASAASTKSAGRGDQAHEASDEEEIGYNHGNRRGCGRVVRLRLA